ncbi:hypothetical protein MKW98_002730 [Papaver atlanticum]|uniref:Uncharacterized protein n=1 Tax=Papaver atlanticum TaxID=357466 RepID=A0AAD4SAQ0_9MAGN|nr:hypothetical protein MKW98_002730 [Papaver atlanticum]
MEKENEATAVNWLVCMLEKYIPLDDAARPSSTSKKLKRDTVVVPPKKYDDKGKNGGGAKGKGSGVGDKFANTVYILAYYPEIQTCAKTKVGWTPSTLRRNSGGICARLFIMNGGECPEA